MDDRAIVVSPELARELYGVTCIQAWLVGDDLVYLTVYGRWCTMQSMLFRRPGDCDKL